MPFKTLCFRQLYYLIVWKYMCMYTYVSYLYVHICIYNPHVTFNIEAVKNLNIFPSDRPLE